jgi:NAD(P)-dependent dehydrogenase (short-subunit alcohol dehydrogenase family)
MDTKKYVVIGGSSGIGLSIVNNLTALGHQVYHFARNEADWEHSDKVQHSKLDITSDEIPGMDSIDSVNGLVYCPGTIELKPFHQITDDDYRKDFEINLLGAARMIRHFYKVLKKGKPASIVLFSTVAVTQGMAFHASVSAAKGAVEGMVRSLAAEFAPSIRVNAIAPSLTDTRLAERLLSTDERREASNKRHPLGRVGRPKDISNMATFLLSDQSEWITGQILHVDGGLSTLKK